jgi:hypothetical protein
MPTSSRRRSSKLAVAPLDLDEIEQDPGFRGMLSFLKVSPEENLRHLALRREADRQSPVGESPMGGSTASGAGISRANPQDGHPAPLESISDSSCGPLESVNIEHVDVATAPCSKSELPMGRSPRGHSEPMAIPSMEVEGRGKRPLRYCRTVQDGHTSSEEIAYEALWAHARRHGETDTDGSRVVDLALSQLRTILNTDHKNVKRLVMSLKSKLALEIVRPPDYRRAISTRYRIFNQGQVLERRRAAGMLWVVRTRTVRFVPMEIVSRLLLGEQPMGG